jgi:hypothetical protein
MALPGQAGQCPNFATQSFPNHGTNNVSVVDQTGTTAEVGHSMELVSYILVGNLGTIQQNVNAVFDAGH